MLQLLAAVNISLFLLNLLPILPLDGGHILPALWEAAKKRLSDHDEAEMTLALPDREVRKTISRAEFERMAGALVGRCTRLSCELRFYFRLLARLCFFDGADVCSDTALRAHLRLALHLGALEEKEVQVHRLLPPLFEMARFLTEMKGEQQPAAGCKPGCHSPQKRGFGPDVHEHGPRVHEIEGTLRERIGAQS